MVVLETGASMVTIGNTQYLQPDYLSPLPTSVSFNRKNIFFSSTFSVKSDFWIYSSKSSKFVIKITQISEDSKFSLEKN